MSITTLNELAAHEVPLWPWTVKEYHRLIELKVVPEGEPYELLGGYLVLRDRSARGADPMTVSPNHAWAVKALAKLNSRLSRVGCHLQTQQPVTLPPLDEPEPDGAIVIGSENDYRGRHPRAKDLACVFEVSDASLRHDRTTKLRAYANAGINRYIIINLPDRVIEVYTDPDTGKGTYRNLVTLTPRDRLELPAARGKRLRVPVKQLLPS